MKMEKQYQAELFRHSVAFFPILMCINLFVWPPYVFLDRQLFPEYTYFLWLRLFPITVGLLMLFYYLRFRWKKQQMPALTLINLSIFSFVTATAYITASTGFHPSYVGGYCLVILATAAVPMKTYIHLLNLLASLITFLLALPWGSIIWELPEKAYSLNDLFTAFVVSALFHYFHEKLRYMIAKEKLKAKSRLRKLIKLNRKIAAQQQEIIRLHEKERHQLMKNLEQSQKSLSLTSLNQAQKSEHIAHLQKELKMLVTDLSIPREKWKNIARHLDLLKGMDEEWEEFKIHFEQVRGDFYERLNQLVAEGAPLTRKDQRFCAYAYMGLSTKEIAVMMNLSARSVEGIRSRVRKKLLIPTDADFHAALHQIIDMEASSGVSGPMA